MMSAFLISCALLIVVLIASLFVKINEKVFGALVAGGGTGVGSRQPVYLAGEWSGIRQSRVNPPKIPELAEGFYCPARARAPAGEAQRDFHGQSGHGPPRGHAPGHGPGTRRTGCVFWGKMIEW